MPPVAPLHLRRTSKAGAILVNVNPAYRLRELEDALRQSGVSVLVLARRFRNTDYVEGLTELAPELRTSDPITELGLAGVSGSES